VQSVVIATRMSKDKDMLCERLFHVHVRDTRVCEFASLHQKPKTLVETNGMGLRIETCFGKTKFAGFSY